MGLAVREKSGQVRGCVGQGRMPGEQPGHHWQRGALEPLGPARNWLQQRLGASLPGPGSRYWLLSGAKPLLVFGVLAVMTHNSRL